MSKFLQETTLGDHAVIFVLLSRYLRGKFIFPDSVVDGWALIDYGDVIFSKAEPDKQPISCTTWVRGRLMKLLGSYTEVQSYQTEVRNQIIMYHLTDLQRNSVNLLFTLLLQWNQALLVVQPVESVFNCLIYSQQLRSFIHRQALDNKYWWNRQYG